MIFTWFPVGMLGANCYLLGDKESREALVVDPGGDVPRILQELNKQGLKLKYIINTHGHYDHVAGNDQLREATGAEVLIHSLDAEMLTSSRGNLSLLMGFNLALKPADRTLAEGDILRLGEIELKVLHTPGHTPGGICLQGAGFVIVGDTLFAGSIGRTDFPGGSYTQLLQSIRNRLLTLPDETEVYCGHGPQTTIGEEKVSNPFL